MIKVLSVFGTRPEGIKMAPVVRVLNKYPEFFQAKVAVTAQHREMLDQVLDLFGIKPDYDLNLMRHGQTLYDITSGALLGLKEILEQEKPDLVLVHGDTTTTFVAALAAFYQQVKVGHVEAGLRTGNKYAPFPEEMNRKMAGSLADYHFAPTKTAKENLLRENVPANSLWSGNTVIDALFIQWKPYQFSGYLADRVNRQRIWSCHRRENWGEPMKGIFQAVKEIKFDADMEVIRCTEPRWCGSCHDILGEIPGIHLIEPLDYHPFAHLMAKVIWC